MCGIAGILRLDGGPVARPPLEGMVDALAHRGPDGRGMHVDGPVGLGHLWLSILDPSPAGAQPMRRGRMVLVHVGEIYNYLELAIELRDHGESFETGTDTEVILAAYRVWGEDALVRFNGMFAFALWDPDRHRLLLARDRMGVKPLYIRRTSRALAFASEPQAFLRGFPLDPADTWLPRPNEAAVHNLLVRGRVDQTTATFLEGVTAIPPGHLLISEDGRDRLARYWGPPVLSDDDRPSVRGAELTRDNRLVDEFRALFDSSVQLRLRSDVSIGTCLSGGLDSSSIVATVAKYASETGSDGPEHVQIPRLAFHAKFPGQGIDESGYADLVARQSDVRLIHGIPAGHPLIASVLPVLRGQGEPYGSASINAQYAVMALAHAEGIKVLLDGQGADELLGGYVHYGAVLAAGLIGAGHPKAGLDELRSQVARGSYSAGGAIAYAAQGSLPATALEAIRRMSGGRLGVRWAGDPRTGHPVPAMHTEPGTLLARRLWQDLSTDGLPALLRYEDRNSMAFGIEARVPFLDYRLVEFGLRLPDRLRINHGVTKYILRRAMRGRLPDAIVDRRDKLGFAAPQSAWLSEGRSDVADLLQDGQVVDRGWVEASEVDRILSASFSGRRGHEQLWRLFITEAWLRMTWPDAVTSGRATWDAALEVEAANRSLAPEPGSLRPLRRVRVGGPRRVRSA